MELRDLFFATPARLKFLKSPRSESNAAQEMVERLAMPIRRSGPIVLAGLGAVVTALFLLAREAEALLSGDPETRAAVNA